MDTFAWGLSFSIYKIKRAAEVMYKDAANLEILSDMRAEC